jgi:hypothetical protein
MSGNRSNLVWEYAVIEKTKTPARASNFLVSKGNLQEYPQIAQKRRFTDKSVKSVDGFTSDF